MKKFSVLFLLVGICSLGVLAYSQSDIANANFLADRNIITKQTDATNYRLDDTITRAEVAGIALKLAGVTLPNNYVCKKYFSDVTKNDWICRAVEMAADLNIISRSNIKFRPQDKITRAEALTMIYKSSRLTSGEIGFISYGDRDIATWQKAIFLEIYGTGVSIPGMKRVASGDTVIMYFYPNRFATRAEIFAFASNILKFKETMSGEATL